MPRAGKLPATITEPAATLVGLLTASELAREKFGADSEVYRNLSIEPELFLRKAELVARYHAKLSKLYAAVRVGGGFAGGGARSERKALRRNPRRMQGDHPRREIL